MKQQHPTPSFAAGAAPPPATTPRPADRVQHLTLGAGQGRLVWVEAGCELRSLSGTTVLQATTAAPGGGQPPPCLQHHAAWRSPHGAWIGLAASEDSPATLALTSPPAATDRSALPSQPGLAPRHEKSRPGHGALQRLWSGLRKRLVRRAQPAG